MRARSGSDGDAWGTVPSEWRSLTKPSLSDRSYGKIRNVVSRRENVNFSRNGFVAAAERGSKGTYTMSPQTNGMPSPFARTEVFPLVSVAPVASAARVMGDTVVQPAQVARAALPWWADGWLTKGFALMLGMVVMAALIFVSSLRAEHDTDGSRPSASTKSGIVSGRTTAPNDARNARDLKSTPRPRAGSTKSGVVD